MAGPHVANTFDEQGRGCCRVQITSQQQLHMSGGQNLYEGALEEGPHNDAGCCKNWCVRQCTLFAIARDHLDKKPLYKAGEARASVETVRASVEPAVFIHISLAIARVSAKE